MTNQSASPDSRRVGLRVRRGAQASWVGSPRDSSGSLSLDSAAAGPLQISLHTRKQDSWASATSPEELLAASHAACFAMALRAALASGGARTSHAEEDPAVNVSAQCTLRIEGTDWRIESMALEVDAPGIDREGLVAAAAAADLGCPISHVMRGNTQISIRVSGTSHDG